MAIYFLPLYVVCSWFVLSFKAKIQDFFWRVIWSLVWWCFWRANTAQIVYGFPSGFLDCSKYRGFSEFCWSWNLCRVFEVKDLVSGVVGGFKNWQCIAEWWMNTVAYKQLHACTGEYLIILEKWCSPLGNWISQFLFFSQKSVKLTLNGLEPTKYCKN